MNILQKAIAETKKFGLLEMADHILYRATDSKQMETRMFLKREKYYNRLTMQQLAEELKALYRKTMGYELDLDDPKTYTEKIQWLKFYDCTPEKTRLADKYLVRDWIKEKIGEEYLIPLLGAWDTFDEIDFDALPNQFCLKMNHGSGMNYIVLDKGKMDKKKVRKLFKAWCNYPYHASTLEFQYRDMPRKIIAEQYMVGLGNNLYNYKVHCFGGEPKFVSCYEVLDEEKHTAYKNYYDLEWNKLDLTFEDFPEFPYEVPKPKRLDEMIDLATKLAEGFIHVRVDLYEVNDKIYFGEMTFTMSSGLLPYSGRWTREADVRLGELLQLPAVKKEK